jgi:hypothetical protein
MITGLPVAAPTLQSSLPGLSLQQTSNSIVITLSNGNSITIPDASSGTNGVAGVLDVVRATIIDTLAAVASSGNYNDLSNIPALSAVALSGSYNSLLNTPALSAVATSGNFSSLLNIPSVVIPMIFDGGGGPIQAGLTRFLMVPFAATITGWTVMADQTGSISIDIWKVPYASFPPTVSNTIVSGHPLVLSSAQSAQGSVANWSTVAINSGDVLAYHITSASTVTAVTAELTVTH